MTERVVKKEAPPAGRGRFDRVCSRGCRRIGDLEQARGEGEDEPRQSFAARASGGASIFLVIRGVMKINSSTLCRVIDLFLNSQPSPGIFPRPGTLVSLTELFSLKMPPITAVPPSDTR